MKLATQIISWVMLAIGVLAVFELVSQANGGTTGNGAGISIGILWVVQSLLTLAYTYNLGVRNEQ